jgi:hypothetical protein
MRTLNISGSLPSTIVENTAPWEWAGGVALLEDPAIVRFVEVEGFAGNFFDARLDSRTGFISITPSARMDAEWFTSSSLSMDLTLGLRFFLTDGTQARGSQSFTVRLQNLDDTPPEALAFTSGGSVRAGVAGAVIGQFGVTDRDTAGGFTFTLSEGDAWQFEVVNGALRLRPGVSVSLADGPERSVTVTVSDGRQESAFTIDFDILPAAGLPQEPVNFLMPGESKLGLSWGGVQSAMPWSGADSVVGFVPIWDIRSVTIASGLVRIDREDRTSLLFDKPRIIDLGSGLIDFRPEGAAASAWLILETVLNRPATLVEIGEYIHRLFVFGQGPLEQIAGLLTTGEAGARFARMTNQQFVREMYANIVPWDPGNDVVNWHSDRMALGLQTRQGLVWDLVNWRREMPEFQQMMETGLYAPRGWLPQIGAMLDFYNNWDLGPYIWEWVNALNAGQLSLRQLARAFSFNPTAAENLHALPDRDFLASAHMQFRGTPMAERDINDWIHAMSRGYLDRYDFIGVLAENIGIRSSFMELPQGTVFQTIWGI